MPPATEGDRELRLVGRHSRPGLGHQPRGRRHDDLRDDASLAPDFFVHCGDTIYADDPLAPEKKLPDGRIWKNLTTEAKSKVAETLADFRGNHLYNFLDANLRRFNAEVPMIALWDDHDVLDNWYREQRLDEDPRYREKSVGVLAQKAERAFREFMPLSDGLDGMMRLFRKFSFGPRLDLFRLDMRSFRAPNGPNRQECSGQDTAFLGIEQVAWLKQALKASTATWKIVAADMPLGLVVYDDWRRKSGFEAVANADDGPPLGRELEIAGLLVFIEARGHPQRALDHGRRALSRHASLRSRARGLPDFTPFYEFVSGPLCAGGFGPNALDGTFGPQVVFQKVPPTGRFDLSPLEGSCHFGT